MRLVDPALPAVRYLMGTEAVDVMRLPIEATGGTIESMRAVQVQYRPGSDVIVRYSAQVSWSGAPARRETLVAASTIHGTHPGAVPITADTPSGPIDIGVWRWPYDPALVGLGDVVTGRSAARVLGIPSDGVTVDVVAFRPTDRVVARVDVRGEAVGYIKVVPPGRAAGIVARHEALADAGVPVADVIGGDVGLGIIALRVLRGPTLRELVKSDARTWAPAREFTRLIDAISGVELAGSGPPSRIADGPLHANMLATILPQRAAQLDELSGRFERWGEPESDSTVHGDLHEGQVIVDAGRIVGLLDIDDIGPGSSIDDWANLIARIRFRATTATSRTTGRTTASASSRRLDTYADELRVAGCRRHAADRLDVHTAAALVGLATGPFRVQSVGWPETIGSLLDVATDLSMRELSA